VAKPVAERVAAVSVGHLVLTVPVKDRLGFALIA
jgi:hypothetical protein